ncbi:MAG: mechanosensitive ion channel family protein [Phycisphaerae bacterium]|nr:mechanosensitive ion channel family protein [Saprospiraceae bacterium]
MDTKSMIDQAVTFAWVYGPKVLIALVLLFGGWWLIRRLTNGFDRFLHNRHVDDGLRPFFTSLADTAMKIVLILMVASTIGIATTSFIAIFSAIAFAVGLALQGSLGNFASGVLIMLFRPFKVGDQLKVLDKVGRVVEIQIFSTILKSSTGNRIIIPNGKMTDGPIENMVEHSEVQAEVTLLLQPGASLDKLQKAAEEAAAKCAHAIPEKEVSVKISGITRDDMKTQISVWTLGQYHDDTVNHFYEALRNSLGAAGIELAKERRKEVV